MCFNSDFVDIVNKTLYHEGNYYAFKSKFFEIYRTVFPNEFKAQVVFQKSNAQSPNRKFDSELKN